MATIKILPHDFEIEVDSNLNLLEALREHDIYVKSGCGGHASCSDCIVKIVEGSENLNEPTFDETQLLGNVFHITKERLSCQTKASGSVTIDITKHDLKIDKEKIRLKTSGFKKPSMNVRKKEDVQKIKEERIQAREEANKDEDWHKHWEKGENDPSKPKKKGGGKRPRPFRTDHLDKPEDENE